MYEGWTNQSFDLDADADAFGTFASFVELWRNKAPPGGLPAWNDFGLEELEPWWGWLCVLDTVDDDPTAFRARLWGTRIAEVLDCEYTGKVLTRSASDIVHDARAIAHDDLTFYRDLIDNRRIGRSFGPAADRIGNPGIYSEVCLPLSSDGQTIDAIMFAGQFELHQREAAFA